VGSSFTEIDHAGSRRPMSVFPIGAQVKVDQHGKIVRRPPSELTALTALSPTTTEATNEILSPLSPLTPAAARDSTTGGRTTRSSTTLEVSEDERDPADMVEVASDADGDRSSHVHRSSSHMARGQVSSDARRPEAPTPEAMRPVSRPLRVMHRPNMSSTSSLVVVDRPFGRMFRPYLQPSKLTTPDTVATLYNAIREYRSALRKLNSEAESLQLEVMENVSAGRNVEGWLLVGKGLHHLRGVEVFESPNKDGIQYDALVGAPSRSFGRVAFWMAALAAALFASGSCE
jgi:hypothetical protein